MSADEGRPAPRRSGPVLTTREAARYCGIAQQTLFNLVSAGEGPKRFKHGRLNAFYVEDLEEWLAGRIHDPMT